MKFLKNIFAFFALLTYTNWASAQASAPAGSSKPSQGLMQSEPAQPATNSPQPAPERKPRVGQIDPNEKDKYKTRFESKDNRIFGFGATKAFSVGSDEVLYAILTGYEWQVGATGGIPAEAQFVFGDSTLYVDATLGFKHYFSDEDFSPFLKGLVGIGAATLKDETTLNGFAYRATAGVTFFRTSTKHLELSASFGSILKKSADSYPKVMTFGVAVLY